MNDLLKSMGLMQPGEQLPNLLYEGGSWLYICASKNSLVASCNRLLNGKPVVGLRVDQVVDLPGDIPLATEKCLSATQAMPMIVRWQGTGEFFEAHVRADETGFAILGHRFLLCEEPFLGTSLMMESFDLKRNLVDKEREIGQLHTQISGLMGSDPLTGLANETRFLDVLETEIRVACRHNTPLALIGCDMDYFRSINESFGREMGDAVLVRLADVLKRFTRREDLAARYRSVTFFVIMPRTAGAKAFTLAERIRLFLPTVQVESEGDNPIKNLSASFSVCEYHFGEALGEFLGRSEAALAEAKRHGRNCTIAAD